MFVQENTNKIVGAETFNYLLEKSRITRTVKNIEIMCNFQATNERNFHIFYFLCKGADINELMDLDLASGQSMDIV